jgi:hypothetical protein
LTPPGAPQAPIFDQISTGSAVIVFAAPVDWGLTGNNPTITAPTFSNFVIATGSGTNATGNATFDTGSTASNVAANWQDINTYNSAYAVRITGYTQITTVCRPTWP